MQETKKCHGCNEIKSVKDFNTSRSKYDGLQTLCKPCSRIRSKKYYADNREHHKKVIKINKTSYIEINRAYVRNLLEQSSCIDCSEKDIRVLEFDHVRGDKIENVSSMINTPYSLDNIKLEIAKCEIRCANCHRKKTAEDQDTWRFKSKNNASLP